MCLIVDANVAHRVLSPGDAEYGLLFNELYSAKSKLRIVYGGKVLSELVTPGRRRQFLELDRSGKARKYQDDVVDKEQKSIEKLSLKSDDPHVLALARVSGARLLSTEDQNLIEDFKDTAIINPKGKIYNRKAHRQLVTDCCG